MCHSVLGTAQQEHILHGETKENILLLVYSKDYTTPVFIECEGLSEQVS